MLSVRPEGYKGKQFENGFTDFFIAGNFFGVIAFQDGITQDDGKVLVEKFKEGLLSSSAQSLAEFESSISNLILKLNFPVHVGLSVGFLYQDVLYLKTVGDGEIYLRRGNSFSQLISGDKIASGFLKQFDLAVFTTTKIQELIGKADDIKAFVEMSKPGEIIQKVNDQTYGDEEKGFVSLFVEFTPEDDSMVPTIKINQGSESQTSANSQEPESPTPTPSSTTSSPTPPNYKQPETAQTASYEVTPPVTPVSPISPDSTADKQVTPNLATPVIDSQDAVAPATAEPQLTIPDAPKAGFLQKITGFFKTKKFTIIMAIIILAILIWSVVFGYQRREAAKLQQKYVTASEEIDGKLKEAKSEATLNIDKSLTLISEAKSLLDVLKKDIGDKKPTEIVELAKKISDAENSVVKKESKNYEEFYDFTLENKNAKGSAIAKEGNLLAVLDTGRKAVYLLDLDSKSLTAYTSPEVASASLVGIYDKDLYFYTKEKEIFKFTSQTKAKDLIAKDVEIKNVVDMELYSGNIYLLDEGSDEIYKYLVTEGGFSSKRTYFGEGQTINLSGAVGMSIDSAIYIANLNNIVKYISGAKESFSPSFPQENVAFDAIYTDRDIDEVYALDKKNSAVYVLSKTGEYIKEIQSSIFNKAKAIFVHEGQIHALIDEKIFTVSLD